MKLLYKYPQAAYPYRALLDENRRRAGRGVEFELLDTGVFDDDRYFDVFLECAKSGPDDICIRIEACNRGPEDAPLHVLPHLWFRNTWGWSESVEATPEIRQMPPGHAGDAGGGPFVAARAQERTLGDCFFYVEGEADLLFTNNETNTERLY